MPSATVENYLKVLYVLQPDGKPGRVALGRLADALGVTPGSTTTMVKRLSESGWVHYEPRIGASLTSRGNRMALEVLRRHRVVELFLVEILGLDWSEVHEEAEVLEHAVSAKVLACMDELLGHPTVDPHGDPIPDSTGRVAAQELQKLSDCAGGEVHIARVHDRDQPFLRYLTARGLTPGIRLIVEGRDPLADLVTVRPVGGEPIQLGLGSAAKILVRAISRSRH